LIDHSFHRTNINIEHENVTVQMYTEPDKLNCPQASTADDQDDRTAWIAASLLNYSLPVWNECLEVWRCCVCQITAVCKVLFWSH